MTKTLKKRFIFTAMLAVTVLLVFLLGSINVAHIVISGRQSEHILSELTESRGAYSPPALPGTQRRFPLRRPSPDDVMGARFFFVVLDASGEAVQTNVKHIYAVSEDDAVEMAKSVYEAGTEEGSSGQFKFRMSDTRDGKGKLVIFLDTSERQNSVFTVLLASCGVGLLCWVAMLLLVLALSKRAIAPIAENIERQKRFVTDAGHEIKTPLASILANVDAMELLSGENKWSRNIRLQANRLNELMQSLLALAKTDELSALPVQEVALTQILEEALELYGEAAAKKRLTLKTNIAPDVCVHANRDGAMQIVSALLDNAVKYTAEEGEVSVLLRQEEHRAVLRVENDCPEQPVQDLERLFDRFYRGDEARGQENGGYGIGLSAARAAAEAHGGSLCAEYDAKTRRIAFSAKL